MNYFISLLVAFLGLFGTTVQAAQSCDFVFKRVGVCAHASWIFAPEQYEESTIQLRLSDLNTGAPVTPRGVKLVLDMPSMGHGSAPTKTLMKAAGTYEISRIAFFMEGDWTMEFQILDGNNRVIDSVLIPITIDW
jgi:hypothetical protein